MRRLEAGLRGVDLVSLRRLLVLEISNAAGDWGRVSGSPEEKSSAEEGRRRARRHTNTHTPRHTHTHTHTVRHRQTDRQTVTCLRTHTQ